MLAILVGGKIEIEKQAHFNFLSYRLWTIYLKNLSYFQQLGNMFLIKTKTDACSLRSLCYQTYEHDVHTKSPV